MGKAPAFAGMTEFGVVVAFAMEVVTFSPVDRIRTGKGSGTTHGHFCPHSGPYISLDSRPAIPTQCPGRSLRLRVSQNWRPDAHRPVVIPAIQSGKTMALACCPLADRTATFARSSVPLFPALAAVVTAAIESVAIERPLANDRASRRSLLRRSHRTDRCSPAFSIQSIPARTLRSPFPEWIHGIRRLIGCAMSAYSFVRPLCCPT